MTLQWDASVRATSYVVTFADVAHTVTTTSRVFTGLDPGINYRFSVVARNSHCDSAASSSTGMTLSTPPTGITSNPATHSAVIAWERPVPVGANNFEIEINGAIRRTGNVVSHSVPNLLPDTSYPFRIRSLNAGGEGPFSATHHLRTMLPTPINLRAEPVTTTSLTLRWDAVPGATSYDVTFAGSATSVPGTSMTYNNLAPGTNFASSVRARNSHTQSAVASRTVTTLSEPPTITSTTPATNSVAIFWTRPFGATNFDVEINGAIRRTGNQLSVSIPGLLPDTPYPFRMRSVNAGGEGPFGSTHSVRTMLLTPLNFRAESTTTSVTLRWDAVPGASSYTVTFNNEEHSVSGTLVTFNNLPPGTSFPSRVMARNQHTQSAIANITATTLSEPPNITSVTPATNSVAIIWERPFGATNFDVEINGEIRRAGNNQLGVSLTGLLPDTTYPFRMRSVNAGGAGPFGAIRNFRTLLTTPLNLRQTGATTTSVTVQWDAVTGATSYEVSFGGEVHSVTGTSRSFSGLEPDSRHTVTVRARNAHSQSNVSANFIATALPPVPQNIATTPALNAVAISWDRIVNATGYDLEFNGNNINVTSTTAARRTHNVSGLLPNTSHTFRVRARNAGGNGAFSTQHSASTLLPNTEIPMNLRIVSVTTTTATMAWNAVPGASSYDLSFDGVIHNATGTSRTVSGLTPDTRYTVNVRSRNAHTHSNPSANVIVTTLPPVPQNIDATATTNAVTVSWDRAVNATGYDLVFNGTNINVTATAAARRSHTVSGLTPATLQRFSVRTRNAAGNGAFSPEQTIYTLLPAPLNLRATALGTNSATVEWNAVDRATSYEVRLNNDTIFTTSSTSWTFTGLNPNTSHVVAVRALNANTSSAFTGNLTFITLTIVPMNVRATATVNSVNVMWDAVPGATNYDVNFNGVVTSLANVLSRNFPGLPSETLHTFSVRSRNVRGSSEFSPQQSIRTLPLAPPIPLNLNGTPTHNTITATWDAVPRATSYELRINGPGMANVVFDVSATTRVGTPIITRVITGLNPSSSYTLWVRANNAGGWSAWSAARVVVTLIPPPEMPLNVRAIGITQTQATISWNAVAGATSYDLNFNGNIVNQPATFRRFTNLIPDTRYTFSVRAVNSSGASTFSPVGFFWTRRRTSFGNSSPNSRGYFDGRGRYGAIDPVDAGIGAFLWDYKLLEIQGKSALDFTLHYNSKSRYSGMLGRKWSHSNNFMLEINEGQAYFTLPAGEFAAFTYDEDSGMFIPDSIPSDYELSAACCGYTVTHVDGTEYVFDSNLHLMEIGQCGSCGTANTKFETNDSGQIVKIIAPNGTSFELHYEGDLLQRVADPVGNTISFEYIGDNLVSAVNPEQDKISFSYDEDSNLTEITDFSGDVYITNAYTDERVVEQSLADRGMSTVVYDEEENVNIYTDESGNEMKYYFDEQHNVTKIEHALGIVHNKYNSNRQIIEQVDELGNITQMAYDSQTRLTEITHPGGATEKATYNTFNMTTKLVNADETEIKFTYDESGNLLSITDERENTELFERDADGNVTAKTDRNGHISRYTYDRLGQLKTFTDPLGNIHKYVFDDIGQVVQTETPLGRATTYHYSPSGNLTRIVENGETQEFTYDANGNTTSITNKMGNTRSFKYDAMGNLATETDFMGNEYSFSYNKSGWLKESVDPLNYKESYNLNSRLNYNYTLP